MALDIHNHFENPTVLTHRIGFLNSMVCSLLFFYLNPNIVWQSNDLTPWQISSPLLPEMVWLAILRIVDPNKTDSSVIKYMCMPTKNKQNRYKHHGRTQVHASDGNPPHHTHKIQILNSNTICSYFKITLFKICNNFIERVPLVK
jgi:hypothetical protein